MVRTKTLLAWSSGKDSAYALWALRQDPDVEVVGLLTTPLAVAGPMFRERLDVELGEVVDRGRFVFIDVRLAAGPLL